MNRRRTTRVHDLVRFALPVDEAQLPEWVSRHGDSAWGVVRRPRALADDATALGLRGRERSQRVAVGVPNDDILEVVPPEDLAVRCLSDAVNPGLSAALTLLAAAHSDQLGGLAWGPTGSAGFELATGIPAVRDTSDLDLILRAEVPLRRDDARGILRFLHSLPCRVDCLLETGRGAVALAEWAADVAVPVLFRTPDGPVLTDDPWQDDAR